MRANDSPPYGSVTRASSAMSSARMLSRDSAPGGTSVSRSAPSTGRDPPRRRQPPARSAHPHPRPRGAGQATRKMKW
jgi:hypothetical protein